MLARNKKERSSAVIVGCSLAVLMLANVVLADSMETYSGNGQIYVRNNGDVVIAFDGKDPIGVRAADTLDLTSDGTTNTLIVDGEDPPEGTTSSVTLDGDGTEGAADHNGYIVLEQLDEDNWEVTLYRSETLKFDYAFTLPIDITNEVARPDCAVGESCGGGCECNLNGGNGICWCFCLFGVPNCVKIKFLFLV